MAGKMNRINRPRGSLGGNGPDSGAAMPADLPEAPDVERPADRKALRDQGLRLNRAFVQIKNPLVREAIINLVTDAATNESARAFFLASKPSPTRRFRPTAKLR